MAVTDFVWARNPLPSGGDIPVQNTSGSAITAGTCLKFDSNNPISGTQYSPGVTPCTATTDAADGFAVEAMAASAQGRMQVEGIALGIATGSITAGAIVGPTTTSGEVATCSSGVQIGKALNTTATAGDTVVVLISRARNS